MSHPTEQPENLNMGNWRQLVRDVVDENPGVFIPNDKPSTPMPDTSPTQPPELTAERLGELKALSDDLAKCHPRDKQARQVREVIGFLLHSASQLHSLRSELATAKERIGELEKHQWQDISTAPKDGTKFIGCHANGLTFTYWNQAYYDKWPHEEGGPTYTHTFTYDRGDAHIPSYNKLVGWMPLPEPPTSHSTKAEGESHE